MTTPRRRPDPADHREAVDEAVGHPSGGVSRRRFIGFVVAGATLTVAAEIGGAPPAGAAVPSVPQVPELYDLGDKQTHAALPS